MISQELLQRYHRLRALRLNEERKLKDRFREEEELKRSLTSLLSDGLEVEHGDLVAEMTPQGRYPDWKSEFIGIAGEDAATEVLVRTPYRMILTVREAVSE